MIETAQAFGVDIGGSGIKAAPVDLTKGDFAEPRLKILTPEVSTPQAVAKIVKQQLDHFEVPESAPVGIAFPAPIKPGQKLDFMANLDQSWIGVDVTEVFSEACGRPVVVVNDADAAGLAEEHYGAGKDNSGVVVLLTFGTGIGSAVIHDGVLLPNTEFGHLQVDGKEAEHRAASSVKERKDWSYARWSEEVNKVLVTIENAIWPDLFIAGGGISRKSDKWLPLLKIRTPIVPATLLNTAGIVGAAMASELPTTTDPQATNR